MFVSFAKEQTDDDCLTDVVIGNGAAQINLPTRMNLPIVQPQPPITPPQLRKSPQLPAKSPDSNPKAGKPKKAKANKLKSNGEQSSSMAMSRLPEAEQKAREMGSSGSNSSSVGLNGESSKSHGSKRRAQSSSKDPSELFIVGSNSQDSSL